MPEGDSVYRQCKMLREALEGAVIESSDFRVPALATSDVSGRTVVAVVPRGKHILIRLSAAPDAAAPKNASKMSAKPPNPAPAPSAPTVPKRS